MKPICTIAILLLCACEPPPPQVHPFCRDNYEPSTIRKAEKWMVRHEPASMFIAQRTTETSGVYEYECSLHEGNAATIGYGLTVEAAILNALEMDRQHNARKIAQ